MEKKEWIVEGNVWKVGNNVNTESITPTHWQQAGRQAMLEHVGELLIPEFPKKVQKNDIWVAGSNLGCSSSRNAAAFMKEKGIAAIICHSAARIFFRNSINSGLPVFEIGEKVEALKMGDKVKVNVRTGEIENLTTGVKTKAKPFPDFLMDILEAGGLRQKILKHRIEYKLLK